MTDKHRMTDEQLGKELESLISGNVESVTPPAGTFLAIQDRLGSQDTDWSPSRLIKKLVPGEWRLPMFTGMFIKATAVVVVAVAIVTVLVFQGRDTDQDEFVPAAEPTATVQVVPTSTLVPVEPTATPDPEPTATPEPFVAVADPIQNPPDLAVLTPKALPAGLDPAQATEQPSEDRVIELWNEYVSDSLIIISDFFPNKGDLHFCADGSVVSRTGQDEVDLELGEPDSWRMSRSAAMSDATWWEAILGSRYVVREGRRDVFQSQLAFKIENGQVVADYLTTTTAVQVYESEYCKNLAG